MTIIKYLRVKLFYEKLINQLTAQIKLYFLFMYNYE